MPMDWQTLQVPLTAGIAGKGDYRAKQAPALEVCRDVEFDDVGGLRTRKPFGLLSDDIFGGTEVADWRRVVENGDELLVFTKDALYSWAPERDSWVEKGEHLAVALDEHPRFVTTGDQIQCDRAELDGTILYTWYDSTVYVAAMDATTGAVIMSPTETAFATSSRPRVLALDATFLLFLLDASSNLLALEVDPTDPEPGVTGSATVIRSAGSPPILGEGDPPTPPIMYDVCRRLTTDEAFAVVTHWTQATYTIAQVPSNTSAFIANAHGRPCEGPIAVASDPTGNVAQVVRVDDDDIEGDQITNTTLNAAFTNTAIGTALSAQGCHQIAAAFRSVQTSGSYRCYVFWSFNEDQTGGSPSPKTNWVNIANATGDEDDFPVADAGPCSASATSIGSRAFDRDGSVYVVLVFGGSSSVLAGGPLDPTGGRQQQLQNTYFLYRDDGFLVGKIAPNVAGGFATDETYTGTAGHLPGVALVGDDVYAWCATERRLVATGGASQGYSARSPRDVLISFDDNRARRCVRAGSTLYISGAQILQYDGEQLVEVGFHVYPWYLELFDEELGAGDVEDGTYTYKETYRWDNAQGERERSTTATRFIWGAAGGAQRVFSDDTSSLPFTRKLSFESPIAVEQWRTLKSPSTDAPFYLITSLDPADNTGANRYRTNGDLGLNDALADEDLANAELNDENGAVLEAIAPPAANIIAASQDRVFLAGIPGDPDRVWYSRKRVAGSIASFHEQNTIAIPPDGGAITGLVLQSETLVVFREHAVYVVGGDGFDNLGGGENYGPARRIPGEVGAVSAEALAICDAGVIFKSLKGWYVLGVGGALQYVGDPVSDFDDEEVYAIHVVEGQHQIRALTERRMLVFDTLVTQWAEWTIADGLDACIWQGRHVYLAIDGVRHELADHSTGVAYGLDIETPWIKLNDLQGRGRVRWILGLGEWRSAHRVRIRIARDYEAAEEVSMLEMAPQLVPEISDRYWDAVLRARPGVTLTVTTTFNVFTSITVRDHERYDVGTASWVAAPDNVGVLVVAGIGVPPTWVDLDTALAGSALVSLVTGSTYGAPAGPSDSITQTGEVSFGPEWFDDVNWTPANTRSGTVEQFRIGPSIQRGQAFKLRITAIASGSTAPPSGEALTLTGLGLEVGVERGLNRRLTAAQKAG